jgi:hypothetical protein
MKKTISILLIIISLKSFACECPEYDLQKLDSESYEWSDLVLIGEVIKTGTNFQIKVTETLKGKVEERIINGTTVTEDGLLGGCSFFPNEKGEYLFYLKETKKNGKSFYLYSQCLGTRRMDFENDVIPLRTNKTKAELIVATEKYIEELRKRKK